MTEPESAPREDATAQEARRLMAEGACDRAIALLARSLRESPESFHLRIALCEAYLRKRDAGEPLLGKLAGKEFEAALRLAPAEAGTHKTLLELAVRLGATERLNGLYSGEWAGLPFAADQQKLIMSLSVPAGRVVRPGMAVGTGHRRLGYRLAIAMVLLVVGGAVWVGLKKGPYPSNVPGVAAPRVLPWLRAENCSVQGFSVDGRYLAISGAGLKIYEVSTGKEAFSYDIADIGTVHTASYSPDGRLMAVAGSLGVNDRAYIRIYDVQAREPTHNLQNRWASEIAWAPDGKRFASIVRSASKLQVWDAQNGTAVYEVVCHGKGADAVAWSPDGKCIVTCGRDATVKAWDSAKGTPMWSVSYAEENADVSCVAFTPDGRLVAGVGRWAQSTRVEVLDGEKGTVLGSDQAGRGGVNVLAAGSTAGWIAASGSHEDGVIAFRLWTLKDNPMFRWSRQMENTVNSMAFTPDGTRLAVGLVVGLVHLYDLTNFAEIPGKQ